MVPISSMWCVVNGKENTDRRSVEIQYIRQAQSYYLYFKATLSAVDGTTC